MAATIPRTPPLPHVTCILTTRDRAHFLPQALHYFLRQDYPHRSLIVVDDGAAPAEEHVRAADDARLHYLRLEPGRRTRGEKRNAGCALAPEGALIAHWDDDDWMAPDRLSRQVAALLQADGELCVGREALYYQPARARAWRERDTLCAPTLLYRKSLWERAPLAARNGGEEQPLLAQAAPERVVAMARPDFYVGVLHDGNTVGRNTGDAACWDAVSVQEAVAPLLAGDTPFYTGLLARRQAARAAPRPRRAVASSAAAAAAGLTSITLAAQFMVYDGYGSMAEHLALGLDRAGARVNLLPLALDLEGTSPRFRQLAAAARPDPRAPLLYFSWPTPQIESLLPRPGGLFINTMWEGSRLPRRWVAWLNRARAVIVPTSFVAAACRDSGVTAPLRVIPEGIDPEIYAEIARPERPGITTLMVGPVAPRKNTLQGIAAWKDAFAGDPTARLLLKARFRSSQYTPDDPRITFVDAEEATRGIAHWYAQADILLALGSEGFGLPLVEGMATGLPVIALDAAGQADTVRAAGPERLLPSPPAAWVPYDPDDAEHGGLRPVPDVATVAEQLRWLATHRDEARAMGRAASVWARRERDIRRKAPEVLALMEEVIGPQTLLRRAATLWTPSQGEACGVAEYTAHLAGDLAADGGRAPARHVARLPAAAGMSLLHVQHEWSLFRDDVLTASVREAKRQGVPVVITEHAVRTHEYAATAWEREADALVTLTEAGAARLRARLPGQRVAWIPPGCPEPLPEPERKQGRVLGSFGFLYPHKGFWKLLALLRERPDLDLELLLLSHAREPALAAAWEREAAGLPVRRVGDFLPLAEIGRRLASADALVFWYDDVPYEAASYAVRIGLASGVPVICSPTRWFRDLRHITYQPAGGSDTDLAAAVERVLGDDALRARLRAAARDYCLAHRWGEIARQHRALWSQLQPAAV